MPRGRDKRALRYLEVVDEARGRVMVIRKESTEAGADSVFDKETAVGRDSAEAVSITENVTVEKIFLS